MVGRKPVVTAEEIFKKIVNFQIFNEKTLYKKHNNVCEADKELDKQMEYSDSKNSSSEDDQIESNKIIIKKSLKRKNKSGLVFNIILSAEDWLEICTEKNTDENKIDLSLTEGWSVLLRKKIFEQTQLPCAIRFNRHYFGQSFNNFLKIAAICTKCEETIIMKLNERPIDKSPVTFEMTVSADTRDIPHSNKKVRLQKSEKIIVENELLTQTPTQWKRTKARTQMKDCNVEPPYLFSNKQLQTAKQDAHTKELGIPVRKSLFYSFDSLKTNPELSKYFRDTGFDRFFLMYWSPDQVSIFNEISKLTGRGISIDATGSVVQKTNRPNGTSGHIFLSAICTHLDGKIIPVCQVLSEKNDVPFYTYWLHSWMQFGAKPPVEVVSDMGKAIQNAACLAFNMMSFSDYNDACLEILQGRKDKNTLNTYVRSDIFHIIHMINDWPCLKNVESRVSLIFKKSIGFMTTISNIDDFSTFLKCLFIISLSKFHNEYCQQSLKYIIEKISTFEFNLNESLNLNTSAALQQEHEPEKMETIGKVERLTHKFIIEIKKKAVLRISNESFIGCQPNTYYSPNFCEKLVVLGKEFPCWTNVMREYFDSSEDVGSSARSETYFGQLKKDEAKSLVRVDKFFVRHCRSIDADMNFARALLHNLKLNPKKQIRKSQIGGKEFLKETENWKNKNEDHFNEHIDHDINNEEHDNDGFLTDQTIFQRLYSQTIKYIKIQLLTVKI